MAFSPLQAPHLHAVGGYPSSRRRLRALLEHLGHRFSNAPPPHQREHGARERGTLLTTDHDEASLRRVPEAPLVAPCRSSAESSRTSWPLRPSSTAAATTGTGSTNVPQQQQGTRRGILREVVKLMLQEAGSGNREDRYGSADGVVLLDGELMRPDDGSVLDICSGPSLRGKPAPLSFYVHGR